MDESRKFWYLFAAYSIVWLLIGGYLLWLGIRQRRNRRQIDRLRARLGENGDGPSPSHPPRPGGPGGPDPGAGSLPGRPR